MEKTTDTQGAGEIKKLQKVKRTEIFEKENISKNYVISVF